MEGERMNGIKIAGEKKPVLDTVCHSLGMA